MSTAFACRQHPQRHLSYAYALGPGRTELIPNRVHPESGPYRIGTMPKAGHSEVSPCRRSAVPEVGRAKRRLSWIETTLAALGASRGRWGKLRQTGPAPAKNGSGQERHRGAWPPERRICPRKCKKKFPPPSLKCHPEGISETVVPRPSPATRAEKARTRLSPGPRRICLLFILRGDRHVTPACSGGPAGPLEAA